MLQALNDMNETVSRYLSLKDERVENWPLMNSPSVMLCTSVIYLLLVNQGPRMMEPYKPVDFSKILPVYNIALVILSAYMFYEFVMSAVLANYSLICQSVDYSDNPLAIRMASVCWWYFASKIIELLDTVIMILKKKNNQISVLHVYHHSTMVIAWWFVVKYFAGGPVFFHAMLNCFIHVLMYTYYALSSFGPWIQKYLWWKRHLTKLQLVQFILITFHSTNAVWRRSDCPFSTFWGTLCLLHTLSLICLFSNFYIRTYVMRTIKSPDLKKE